MGDLSDHFGANEFECRGKLLSGHPSHPLILAPGLVEKLELLRERQGGRALKILSGHRCSWYNIHVGGAKASQHIRGAAVDIPQGYCRVQDAARCGFRGIGTKGEWAVHLDVRRTVARWTY